MRNSLQKGAADVTVPGLEKVIDSITEIVDFETANLKQNQSFDIATSNLRKARLLLDLNTALRGLDSGTLPATTNEKLKTMQMALRRNQRQFHAHASAIREVIAMIIRSNRDQQSDGTYSAFNPA